MKGKTEVIIKTHYEEIPYYLKGITSKGSDRTVIWTTTREKAMRFENMKAAKEFQAREKLYRLTEYYRIPAEGGNAK